MIIGLASVLATTTDTDTALAAEMAISLTRPANRLEAAIQLRQAEAAIRYAIESETPNDELLTACRCLVRAMTILPEYRELLAATEDVISGYVFGGEFPPEALPWARESILAVYALVGRDADGSCGFYYGYRPTIH